MDGRFTCYNATVTILDDYIVEHPETFIISLDSVDPPCPIGQRNSSTVVILDDDCELILMYSLFALNSHQVQ